MKPSKTTQVMHPLPLWANCAPQVSTSIKRVSRQWEPFSADGSKRDILQIAIRELDPAIKHYAAQFPRDHIIRHLKPPGFYSIDGLCEIGQSIGLIKLSGQIREISETYIRHTPNWNFSDKLGDTLQCLWHTLEELDLYAQSGPHPHSEENKRGTLCRLCGEFTEQSNYQNQKQWPAIDHLDSKSGTLKLSAHYCQSHRTAIGRKHEAEHKSAKRKEEAFEIELRRLRFFTCHSRVPANEDMNPTLVRFFNLHQAESELSLLDRRELRNLARDLVDTKMNDQKKMIVAMLTQGKSKSEIAAEQGLTRQAIHKAIKSIPERFRLGLSQTGASGEK